MKRFIQTSRPKDKGNICIVNDKLLLHQYHEPLVIYDLNKLINNLIPSQDCIDFSFSGEANINSNIVTDGNNCYFCSWELKDEEKNEHVLYVYAVSLENYAIIWNYQIEEPAYSGVHYVHLYKNQLFLAADYGCVYSLNASNGKLLWSTKITDKEHYQNILTEGVILEKYFVIPCDSNGWLYYFDITNGKIVGKKYVPVFGGRRHCYVEDDYLYITTGSYITRLRLKNR